MDGNEFHINNPDMCDNSCRIEQERQCRELRAGPPAKNLPHPKPSPGDVGKLANEVRRVAACTSMQATRNHTLMQAAAKLEELEAEKAADKQHIARMEALTERTGDCECCAIDISDEDDAPSVMCASCATKEGDKYRELEAENKALKEYIETAWRNDVKETKE